MQHSSGGADAYTGYASNCHMQYFVLSNATTRAVDLQVHDREWTMTEAFVDCDAASLIYCD